MQQLLQQGCAPMPRDREGWTPLHIAAEHERIAPLQLLLRCERCDVDTVGPNGCTPLMLAAHAGARQCCAALLEARAALEERDDGGATALCAAAAGRKSKTLQLLLQAGADPQVRAAAAAAAAALASSPVASSSSCTWPALAGLLPATTCSAYACSPS